MLTKPLGPTVPQALTQHRKMTGVGQLYAGGGSGKSLRPRYRHSGQRDDGVSDQTDQLDVIPRGGAHI